MLTTASLGKGAHLPAVWLVFCRPATVCGPPVLPCVHQTSYDAFSFTLIGSVQGRFLVSFVQNRAIAPCADVLTAFPDKVAVGMTCSDEGRKPKFRKAALTPCGCADTLPICLRMRVPLYTLTCSTAGVFCYRFITLSFGGVRPGPKRDLGLVMNAGPVGCCVRPWRFCFQASL